jgi:hypothetical protein
MAGKPWSEERKRKFSEAVIQAHIDGKYKDHDKLLSKQRLENLEWRANQKAAASKKMKTANPMVNPKHRQAMVEAKQAQFSGYELPSWYTKQGGNPIYNRRLLPIFERLCQDLGVSIAYYGTTEKRFGRYWVDFYAPELNLALDWNEMHHEKEPYQSKDLVRLKHLQENNPDITFISLKESEYLIDGYSGEATYQKIFLKVKRVCDLHDDSI